MKKELSGALLGLLLLPFNLLSQGITNSSKILESIWSDQHKVNVVPEGALSGDYNILVYPYVLRTEAQDGIIYALDVSWESAAIDGRYIMEITPLQILLYSQHDNPDSNYLYWMHNLKDGEYYKIKSHFQKLTSDEVNVQVDSYSGKSSFMFNWLFTDPPLRNSNKVVRVSEQTLYEKLYQQTIKDHLYLNAFLIAKEINECLKNGSVDFPDKDAFFSTRIIRIIGDKSELNNSETGSN